MRVDKSKWEKVKLGDCGLIVTGITPSKKNKDNYSQRDFLFVKPGDLRENGITIIEYTEDALSNQGFQQARKIPAGAVLVTCIGTIGKVGISASELSCNQQINAIIPNDNVSSSYLSYSIFGIRTAMSKKANGPVVPIINKTTFSSFEIPLPPLFEQRAIAEELDGIQSMIGKCREQLEDYDRLARSIFHEMFGDPVRNDKGWEVKKLKGLFINRDSERVPLPSSYRKDHKGIYDYYGACGVIDSIDDFIFDEKLLLIGEDGANLVTCSKPNAIIASGKYWVNNHAHVLQCTNCIDIVYACYAFNYIDISSYITGVAQPKLNQSNLNKIAIPLPPLPLQQKFAERIEAIEKMKEATKAQLADLQQLFDSRMQYYFS